MVEEPLHVKQLSQNHVCEIGLKLKKGLTEAPLSVNLVALRHKNSLSSLENTLYINNPKLCCSSLV
jgi:hypothetical protein